jgi:hypothetical protein
MIPITPPPSWTAILTALTRGGQACRTPDDLARILQRDSEVLTDDLADMHIGGWLDVWERPDGIAVTLTPWAAARLGVHLTDGGRRGRPRWTDKAPRDDTPPRALGVTRALAVDELDLLPDRLPPPEVVAELNERGRGRGAIVPRGQGPYPTRLVGERLCPWPGPAVGRAPAAPCPACGGADLRPLEYCLRCDRWGFDEAHRAARAAERAQAARFATSPPRPHAPRATPALDEAARLRARRKARRRARLRARAA